MGAASDLQLSLIVLAVVFVFAVWLYNRWQEYRQRRSAGRIFDERRGDPLAGAIAGREGQDGGGRQRIEPVIGGGIGPEQEMHAVTAAPPLELADPAIDCLVTLNPRDELAAPVFWQAQRQYLDAFAASLRWLAWRQGQWRHLSAHDAGNCSAFVGALQLADRSGPLDEETLARFGDGVTRLAEAIGAALELPPAAEVLAQAEELDRFCASVDWRIALNLVGRGGGPLAGEALRAVLKEGRYEQEEGGPLHALDAAGQTQFLVAAHGGTSLLTGQEISGLSLSIDVPLAADGVAAFDCLLEFARALMAKQQVELVDEQRQPLADAALGAIRAKIAEFQEKMRAAEIPAGGRRALRLYA